MGRSGSGKSTLLHCLAGILTPGSGEIVFAGRRLDTMTESEQSAVRRDRFGARLTIAGGREAIARLALIAIAVAIGAGLLLTTIASLHAVNAQNDRFAWPETGFAGPTEQYRRNDQIPAQVDLHGNSV